MLQVSKDHNPNYLAKIVRLQGLRKHPNADRLQCVDIDFNTVITGLDAKDGDVYVYFPLECKINKDFLSATNSFRHKELNVDKEKAGFFDDNCRVRAMRLRGEKSMGYIIPIHVLASVYGTFGEVDDIINTEFDTVNGTLLLEKYEVKTKQKGVTSYSSKGKNDRTVDNQINLHADTLNLRKNAYKISPQDRISITYKTHGTSFWVANVLTKRELSLMERLLLWLKLPIKTLEYGIVYGSRKVIKNKYSDHLAKGYYGEDIWGIVAKEIQDKIPQGFTLYGEILGFTPNGRAIQPQYDYGAVSTEHIIEIYRITHTTPSGLVTELSEDQIVEFCKKAGLRHFFQFYNGLATDLFPYGTSDSVEEWQTKFIKFLEEKYNDKDCFMCKNKVPEEGIVLRKEGLFGFEAYKLKSFKFLEKETNMLDQQAKETAS